MLRLDVNAMAVRADVPPATCMGRFTVWVSVEVVFRAVEVCTCLSILVFSHDGPLWALVCTEESSARVHYWQVCSPMQKFGQP